jgi:hypothetical protein
MVITLDLIITLDLNISQTYTFDPAISDHLAVFAKLQLPTISCIPRTITFRKLRKFDFEQLASSYQQFEIIRNSPQDADSLVANYNVFFVLFSINKLLYLPRSVNLNCTSLNPGIPMKYTLLSCSLELLNVRGGNHRLMITVLNINNNAPS